MSGKFKQEMMPYEDAQQMAEDQYAEVEDQLLKEVPIAHGAQRNIEKENPPAVSIPIGNTPILSPIPEESDVHTGNPGIPMTISEEQDMAKRWDQLKQAGTSTNVQRTNPSDGK